MEKKTSNARQTSAKSCRDDHNTQHSAARASISRSEKAQSLRTKGNEFFKQASDVRFSRCVRRSRLDHARQLYEDALSQSHSANDKASCYKNLGATRMSLYKLELESVLVADVVSSSSSGGEEQLFMAKGHVRNSVDFYVQALYHGTRAGKVQEWLDNLRTSLTDLVQWTLDQSRKVSWPANLCLLRGLCQAFVEPVNKYPAACQCEAAILAHKILAESLFQHGIKELCKDEADGRTDERGRYINCLQFVQDCYQPLSVANSLSSIIPTGKKLLKELKDLEEEVRLYENICQSVKARIEGDRLLRQALHENEVMNVDWVWDAVDSYKQAVLLTRERDVENEAIATSRIGKVYTEVVKDIKKAHGYHFQATKLGLSIVNICPRIVTADWYLYSNKKVEEYQENIVREETKLREVKRAPVVIKLEEKLLALSRKASESTESFLRYIYTEYPHPDSTKQLGPLSTKKLVHSALKKALVHYHPDTNMKHGEEWLVLCEEIAKYLNRKYENYKAVD